VSRNWTDISVQPKQWKRDRRFGTCTVRSLYRAGSVAAAAARELVRYKLDLVGVQVVRWDREGTVRAGDYMAPGFCQLRTKFWPTSCCQG